MDTESESVDIDSSQNDNSNTISSASMASTHDPPTNYKKKKSSVWNVFVMLNPEEQAIEDAKHKYGKKRAKCKHCGHVLVGESHSGTTNMHRHIKKCPKLPSDVYKDDENGNRKIDPNVAREMIAESVITHGYPFEIVEHFKLRAFHCYLNNTFKPICRNICKADCLKLHNKFKASLKSDLEKVSSRICLTCDMWTSCTSDGYLCLTGHFIDDDWKLRSVVLNFHHIPPSHTSNVLYNMIFGLLKEWGIEKKVFSITLDNASNMDCMQQLLSAHLDQQGALLCHGKFFHIRCAAHILNLVVQDGLKVIKASLEKVRELVKYVEGSESRKIRFRGCVIQEKLNYSKGLWLDVATRWNSTYLMLERFIYFREAFVTLKMMDENCSELPSSQELRWIEKISEFLQPLYEITTLFSGRDYPIANLYFENVWQVQKNIEDKLVSEDPLMAHMAREMKKKFSKYWKDYTLVLAFAAILDPRLKLQVVQYLLPQLGSDYGNKWEDILAQMKLLFKEYEDHSRTVSRSSMVDCNNDESGRRRKVSASMSGFKNYDTHSISNKSELDVYLDEARKDYEKQLDVLDYWKNNQFRYPILSVMAKDILSVPITTVASESTFSMGSRVINKWRNCLTTENAEILITTRNWLYGYDAEEKNESTFGRDIKMLE